MCFRLLIIIIILFFTESCGGKDNLENGKENNADNQSVITPGAYNIDEYIQLLTGKNVSFTVNQTAEINGRPLVDTLLKRGVTVDKIFTPEHGFKGLADAGEAIHDQNDSTTGIKLISLYGDKRKPDAQDLVKTDIMVFDIQDVGTRFYTYISTLHLVMEACAENQIPLLILDRPNPNGHFVDGPVRLPEYRSFVAMDPIPIVYGLTIGELASMINGEGWLSGGLVCDLKVIACQGYDHKKMYTLPVKPSPNLPNLRSILLYPSLCFFEGTPLSIGRGTDLQFQVIGHPSLTDFPYAFTPTSGPGSTRPKLEDQACYGEVLTGLHDEEIFAWRRLNLTFLIRFYNAFPDKSAFFNENNWFDRLAGTVILREMIVAGKSEDEIRSFWKPGVDSFLEKRKQYLLYPDFD